MTENNDSFAALFAEEEQQTQRKLIPGQQLTATVAGISGESIFLDIGGKSEGVLNSSECTGDDGELTVAVGDAVEVYYIQTRGPELMFTTRVGSGSTPDHLEEAWRSQIPVEGKVQAEIKGGFEIKLGGNTRAFCPYSQMGLRRVENGAEHYVDQQLTFLITKFEAGGRNIVVSARAILEREREKQRELLKESLAEGDTVEGEITSIRDFGAFLDIGGVEGLIPISEIGWSRVENVNEYLTEGQKVKAIVKSLDWEKNRLSFSLKETLENPWEKAQESFPPGSTHMGTVVRLAAFGAFVNLAEGIDGLIHISKLGGGRRIHHPREVLEAGQQCEVKIDSFDAEQQKIGLAPADYVSEENKDEDDRTALKKYQESQPKSNQNMGSLGALLQAKLQEKKKN